MSSEIDLSGETDPTERMVKFAELRAGNTVGDVTNGESPKQQERAQEAAERDDNLRDAEHEGSVETDSFDIEEALSAL